MQNRPAFEIPYSEIINTNLAGKNEVAVEFSLPANGTETGTNGDLGGARARGRKAGAGKDQLVEMRFYIPGVATKAEKGEEGEDKSDDGEDVEEQNAANLFYETLMDKADIGDVAGDTIATFLEVLHLTPRSASPQCLCFNDPTDSSIEDDSISTCTRLLSDYAAKPTTTRSRTIKSRNSCSSPSQMISTPSLLLASILLYDKVRPNIRS